MGSCEFEYERGFGEMFELWFRPATVATGFKQRIPLSLIALVVVHHCYNNRLPYPPE